MTEVIFSSCYDEKNPPENIFDSSKNKFFCSTGMFPQEICVQFEQPRTIRTMIINGYGMKKVRIQSCSNDSVVNFQKQAEQGEISFNNKSQSIKLDLTQTPTVKVLKIEVLEGYEDFFTITNVNIS